MNAKKKTAAEEATENYDKDGAAQAASGMAALGKLDADVEHSIAEVKERIRRIAGGMQSHEAQDLQKEINDLLAGMERELREEYGS